MTPSPFELAEKKAELSYLRARAARLEAELEAAGASTAGQTSPGGVAFDPGWKVPGRPNLSAKGRQAVLDAFNRGLRPAEVARMFRITDRAAADWHARWQAQSPATAPAP